MLLFCDCFEQMSSFYKLRLYIPFISRKLKMSTDAPMMKDCPHSNPLIPARMLMALVQKTANIPMYT